MVKALFLLEFRRLFFPSAASLVALVGAIWGIELLGSWFGRGTPQTSIILDGILLALLALSGFFSGRATFPQDLKQRHYLFFQSLPFGRGKLWTILFLASMFSALLSLVLALSLRPSVLLLDALMRTLLPLMALSYLLLFASGACFSLLYRNGATVLLSGILGTAIPIVVGLIFSFAYVSDPGSARGLRLPSAGNLDRIDGIYTGLCGFSLFVLYAASSYRFFIGGEFHLFGLRVKRTLALIGSSLMLMVGWMALQETDLLVVGDDWSNKGFFPDAQVSHDGNHVAILEQRRRHPRFIRVNIIDARSGWLISRIGMSGALSAGWSSDKNLLGILRADDAPLKRLGYILSPSDTLIWITPDGREVARTRFQGSILSSHLGSGGKSLVVVKNRDQFELTSNRDGTEEIQKLAASRIPANTRRYGSEIRPMGARFLVRLSSETAWIIDENVREIHIPKTESRERPYIVRDVVFPNEGKAQEYVAKMYPFDWENAESRGQSYAGRYLLPYPDYFDESTSLFYGRRKADSDSIELWVRDRKTGSWKLLTRDMPVPFFPGSSSNEAPLAELEWRHARPHEGLLLYRTRKNGKVQWHLYDDHRSISLRVGPPVPEKSQVLIYEPGPAGQFIVSIYELRNQPEKVIDWNNSVYFARSGTMIQLPLQEVRGDGRIIFVSRDGSFVLRDAYRWLFSVRPGEEPRRLWPQ